MPTLIDSFRGWNRTRIAKRRLNRPRSTPDGFEMVGSPIFFEESWEVATRAAVRDQLSSVSRVVNVGANAGYYCLMAAKMGIPSVAIEPGPTNLRYLQRNIEINGFDHIVSVLPYAISKESGCSTLFGDGTGASLLESKSSAPMSVSSTIDTRSWADTNILLTASDLVVIDVEGHEGTVIDSMIDQLTDSKPTLILEIDSSLRTSPLEKLTAAGYRHIILEGNPYAVANYLFCRTGI